MTSTDSMAVTLVVASDSETAAPMVLKTPSPSSAVKKRRQAQATPQAPMKSRRRCDGPGGGPDLCMPSTPEVCFESTGESKLPLQPPDFTSGPTGQPRTPPSDEGRWKWISGYVFLLLDDANDADSNDGSSASASTQSDGEPAPKTPLLLPFGGVWKHWQGLGWILVRM